MAMEEEGSDVLTLFFFGLFLLSTYLYSVYFETKRD